MSQSASTGTQRPVRVLQITDPHLFSESTTEIYGIRTADSLARVLEQAACAEPRPDAILVTGDVGDDLTEAAYRRFRDALAPLELPVYCLPGNHDDPSTMARVLGGGNFQVGGTAMLGAWRLLLLDSHVAEEPFGMLGPARLDGVDQDLSECAGHPVLLAVHHPPMPVGSPWIDALGLRDGAALLDLLARHAGARAVTCGHVHQAFEGRHAHMSLFTTPSTCAQFTPRTERCVIDTRPPGWRTLTLWPDGRIESAVHWLEGWSATSPLIDSRAGESTADGSRSTGGSQGRLGTVTQ